MMLHGDYHTSNVHYSNGEAILIDMDTLAVGNPIFEFASIYLAYKGYGELDHSLVENFIKLDWNTANYVFEKLIDLYFADKDEAFKNDVINKARIVGYTRALRRTIKRHPERTEHIEYYKKQLIDLVNQYDTLTF